MPRWLAANLYCRLSGGATSRWERGHPARKSFATGSFGRIVPRQPILPRSPRSLARRSKLSSKQGKSYLRMTHGSDLSARAGCFVSIKTRAGELRGCTGTIDPSGTPRSPSETPRSVSATPTSPSGTPRSSAKSPHSGQPSRTHSNPK